MEEENNFRKKRDEIGKNLDKGSIDFDAVSKESQMEDNSSDIEFISEEEREKHEFNTFGEMNDDMPDEYIVRIHKLWSAILLLFYLITYCADMSWSGDRSECSGNISIAAEEWTMTCPIRNNYFIHWVLKKLITILNY